MITPEAIASMVVHADLASDYAETNWVWQERPEPTRIRNLADNVTRNDRTRRTWCCRATGPRWSACLPVADARAVSTVRASRVKHWL